MDSSFEWSEKYQQCVRICVPSDTNYITGLDTTVDLTLSTCTCKSIYYVYDKKQHVCVEACHSDPHATPTDNSGTLTCVCHQGYEPAKYNGETFTRCGLPCKADTYTSGKDTTNPDACLCNTGFVWPDGTKYTL
jgi:hypothetical protein